MNCRKIAAATAAILALPCYGAEAMPSERIIPVADFRSPPLLFTCVTDGLPSVGVNYGETKRRINYNDVVKGIIFYTDNSVKSVVEQETADGLSWKISSSGPALNESGPLGYEAKIDVVVTKHADGHLTADWVVHAGDFTSNERDCRHMIPPQPIARNAQ